MYILTSNYDYFTSVFNPISITLFLLMMFLLFIITFIFMYLLPLKLCRPLWTCLNICYFIKAFLRNPNGNCYKIFSLMTINVKTLQPLYVFFLYYIHYSQCIPCFRNVFYLKQSYYLTLIASTLHCFYHKIYNFLISVIPKES